MLHFLSLFDIYILLIEISVISSVGNSASGVEKRQRLREALLKKIDSYGSSFTVHGLSKVCSVRSTCINDSIYSAISYSYGRYFGYPFLIRARLIFVTQRGRYIGTGSE